MGFSKVKTFLFLHPMNPLEISVIVSTYNAEEWLEKVLWGFETQTYQNFELIIADDGSGPKTKSLIDDLSQKLTYPIVHVWQEDEGFQKSRILNKALKACRGNYVVMTDGDCIPRPDFLQVHYDRRKPGHFLSGGYFMLPMTTSKAIQIGDITSSICFNLAWLKENGVPSSRKNLKLTATGKLADFLNWITPTKATWNGHNASGWLSDLLEANGFDERMQYGGQDRELGERLMNKGVKGIQIRYSAICIHLDHKRGYKTPESLRKNRAIRDETIRSKSTFTPYGIRT